MERGLPPSMKVQTQFRAIEARRFQDQAQAQVRVQHDTQIQSVEARGTALVVRFAFTTQFGGLGVVRIEGDAIATELPAAPADLAQQHAESQKLPDDVMQPLLQTILAQGVTEAVVLSREVRLPPPMPLPQVKRTTTGGSTNEPVSGMDAA